MQEGHKQVPWQLLAMQMSLEIWISACIFSFKAKVFKIIVLMQLFSCKTLIIWSLSEKGHLQTELLQVIQRRLLGKNKHDASDDLPSLPHLPINCQTSKIESGMPQRTTCRTFGMSTPIPNAIVQITTRNILFTTRKASRMRSFESLLNLSLCDTFLKACT